MALKLGDILSNINNSLHRLALGELMRDIFGLGPTASQGSIHIGSASGHPGIDTIQLNTSFEDGSAEGRLQWNSDDGTLEYGLPGGNVNLQVGQEHLIRVYNKSGADMTNGTPVYVTGAQGSRPTVEPADASSILTASSIGLLTEAIADNHYGFLTVRGLVRDVNTSGLDVGGPVYVSTTAGAITKTAPDAPNITTLVGICLYKHATVGILLVDITIMQLIQYLSDVYGTPSDGDTIRWNATNERFEFGA